MSKRIRSKVLKSITLTLALSSIGTVTAFADGGYWQQAGSNWYYKDNSTGRVETGWIQDNGYWYYLNSTGVMQTGWIYDSGNWYYLYGNGQMATNTTIDGYYLSSTGAWTTSTSVNSGTPLTAKDSFGTHVIRGDISQSQDDVYASEQLSTINNMTLNDSDKTPLKSLAGNLTAGRATLDEVKANCIGKTVGQYVITDIKYFDQVFSVGTGTSPSEKIAAIKSGKLSSYKSTSNYSYDQYLVFSCGNERASEWEAIRIVVEFEAA